MKIVIPIAGRGSRFQNVSDTNQNYKKPKPFIEIKGYPMVRWATGSLPNINNKDLIFIILNEHEQNYSVTELLINLYGKEITIITIPDVTRGAAETVLQAKEYINHDEQLIISDSDHFVDGKTILDAIEQNGYLDGLIPVFEASDPKWSFSRIDNNGFVDLVAEKQPISKYANIGVYYFKKGADFVAGAELMIQENELTNNEFFIAPVYNKLIQQGKKIRLVFPKYVYGLGTPEDLEYFITNTNYSLSL